MLTSNSASVKVPITSGNFTMVAKGRQKHRVFIEVWGEGQITTLRVTCQKTGKEWFFDTFDGKLRRGFSPDGKLPNCELSKIEFEPARPVLSQSPIPCYPDWIECAGRPYLVPSNEPTDDGFIYEDTEPSDLSRYKEAMTNPMTWEEF